MEVGPRCTPTHENLQAGYNRAKKLLKQKSVRKVYLALDADELLEKEVCALCEEAKITPDRGHTKAELGVLCGLEVGCAVCVIPV